MRVLAILGLTLALLAPSLAAADDAGPPYEAAQATCGVNGFPIPSHPCPRAGAGIGSEGAADGAADAATGALRVDARATGTLAVARGSVADAWSMVHAIVDASRDGAVRVRLENMAADALASCPSCALRATGLQGADAWLTVFVQVSRPGPGGPVIESEVSCSIGGTTPATFVVPGDCPGAGALGMTAGVGRSVVVLLAARAMASGGGSARAAATVTVSSIALA